MGFGADVPGPRRYGPSRAGRLQPEIGQTLANLKALGILDAAVSQWLQNIKFVAIEQLNQSTGFHGVAEQPSELIALCAA